MRIGNIQRGTTVRLGNRDRGLRKEEVENIRPDLRNATDKNVNHSDDEQFHTIIEHEAINEHRHQKEQAELADEACEGVHDRRRWGW